VGDLDAGPRDDLVLLAHGRGHPAPGPREVQVRPQMQELPLDHLREAPVLRLQACEAARTRTTPGPGARMTCREVGETFRSGQKHTDHKTKFRASKNVGEGTGHPFLG